MKKSIGRRWSPDKHPRGAGGRFVSGGRRSPVRRNTAIGRIRDYEGSAHPAAIPGQKMKLKRTGTSPRVGGNAAARQRKSTILGKVVPVWRGQVRYASQSPQQLRRYGSHLPAKVAGRFELGYRRSQMQVGLSSLPDRTGSRRRWRRRK